MNVEFRMAAIFSKYCNIVQEESFPLLSYFWSWRSGIHHPWLVYTEKGQSYGKDSERYQQEKWTWIDIPESCILLSSTKPRTAATSDMKICC